MRLRSVQGTREEYVYTSMCTVAYRAIRCRFVSGYNARECGTRDGGDEMYSGEMDKRCGGDGASVALNGQLI